MKKLKLIGLTLVWGLMINLPVFAQEATNNSEVVSAVAPTAAAPSSLSIDNYIPWILLITALALGIVIVFMGSLLSKVAIMKMNSKLKSLSILLVSFSVVSLNASTGEMSGWQLTTSQLNYMLLAVIGLEVLIILYFAYWLKAVIIPKKEKTVVSEAAKSNAWWDNFNKSVKIENEKDVQLDHEYDGIGELNNALPPWWLYGFYITIAFAAIYMYRYHIGKTAPLQVEELRIAEAEAKLQAEAYAKTQADKVDENTIEYKADPALIASGKAIFEANCVACHAKDGGGNNGPNLTDDYWKHGGSIKDIFKTIKMGVPQMGMIAWGQTKTPKEIAALATFVKSLKGSKPADPKPPYGTLYTEDGATQNPVSDTINKIEKIKSEK